jgi:hypothetical protein
MVFTDFTVFSDHCALCRTWTRLLAESINYQLAYSSLLTTAVLSIPLK